MEGIIIQWTWTIKKSIFNNKIVFRKIPSGKNLNLCYCGSGFNSQLRHRMATFNLFINGHFHDLLPPCFSIPPGLDQEVFTKEFKKQEYGKKMLHSMEHETGRRFLSVTEPANQWKLCNFIESNWLRISNHLTSAYTSNTFVSLSNPTKFFDAVLVDSAPETQASLIKSGRSPHRLDKKQGDNLLLNTIHERVRKRMECYSQGSFLLCLDVANFFGSIYTHSIEWAFGGKKDKEYNYDEAVTDEALRFDHPAAGLKEKLVKICAAIPQHVLERFCTRLLQK